MAFSATAGVFFQDVLKTIASPEAKGVSTQPRRTLEQARGLLVSTRPIPSDDEIARWLEERRSQRCNL